MARLPPTITQLVRQNKQNPTGKRLSARDRGYGTAWQKARIWFLRENPLCKRCQAEGRVEAATIVHHTLPHRGNQLIFWDRSKWEAICKAHHDKITGQGG